MISKAAGQRTFRPAAEMNDIVADLGFQSWVCAEVMLKALGSAMQDFSIRDHLAPFSRPP